jgi:hypothetical protein
VALLPNHNDLEDPHEANLVPLLQETIIAEEAIITIPSPAQQIEAEPRLLSQIDLGPAYCTLCNTR